MDDFKALSNENLITNLINARLMMEFDESLSDKKLKALRAELLCRLQQRDAAVAALRAVEWVPVYQDRGHTWYGCPACRSDREYGKHTADCQLAAALVRESLWTALP